MSVEALDRLVPENEKMLDERLVVVIMEFLLFSLAGKWAPKYNNGMNDACVGKKIVDICQVGQ